MENIYVAIVIAILIYIIWRTNRTKNDLQDELAVIKKQHTRAGNLLQKAIDTIRIYEHEYRALSEANTNVNNIRIKLESEKEELKSKLKVQTELAQKYYAESNENLNKYDEVTVLKNQTISQLETTKDKLDAVQVEIAEKINHIEWLREEFKQMKLKLNHKSIEYKQLQSRYEMSQKTLAGVTSELTASQARADSLLEEKNKLTIELNDRLDAISEISDNVKNLTTTISALDTRIKEMIPEHEYHALESKYKKQMNLNNTLTNDNIALSTAKELLTEINKFQRMSIGNTITDDQNEKTAIDQQIESMKRMRVDLINHYTEHTFNQLLDALKEKSKALNDLIILKTRVTQLNTQLEECAECDLQQQKLANELSAVRAQLIQCN